MAESIVDADNNYSDGEKHIGMYADYKLCDHDSWCKTINEHCAA